MNATRLTVGSRLGPYDILSPLGAGGFGQVYKARDTRLDRTVAIKILPSADPELKARFELEAKAIAALTHPHICTLYDVGHQDETDYLVMEYLEGETLAARITRGPLEITDVVDTGLALAEALETAHAAGILHRDIKPANIFLTSRGPKLLDFGLAKTAVGPPAAASMTTTVGLKQPLTERGATVGTIAYMSPEQLCGERLDTRTDLFSFGLVLYEMASGRRAFPGATSAVVAAAILHQQPPPPGEIRPHLPERLNDVILKAIEKDRALRYQHASDIGADLQRLRRDTDSAALVASAKPGKRAVIARRWTVVSSAVVAILLLGFAGYVSFHHAARLTDKDTIVLADFKNTTGDAVFDETLRQGLAIQLEQSPLLSLVSEQRLQGALRLMGQPADAQLTPEIARAICERIGSDAVLDGSITSLGSHYVLGLRAQNCRTGDILDQEQVQAEKKEDVLNTLDRMASTFRTRVGESLGSIEKHSTPLAEATTPSLDALKAYSAAYRRNIALGWTAALPLYKRAVEIDAQFAMAYAFMGLMYSNLGESVLAAESTTKAYQLQSRTSDPERFFITAMYDRQVTGNLERERQTLELWAQTYPGDTRAHGLLAGFATNGTGKYEQSIDESKKALVLDPDSGPTYLSLANDYLYLDRLKDVELTLQRASERRIEIVPLNVVRYYLSFLKDDRPGMDRAVALGKGKPGAEDQLSSAQALVLARSGQLEQARKMLSRAVDAAQQAGQKETAATYKTGMAVWEAFYGNPQAARRSALDALELSQGRDVEYAAAFALALAGDVARSEAVATDLERRFPEDTSVRFSYLPALRGLFALNANEPSRAIESLQDAFSYELARPGIAFFGGYFGTLYPAYVRGTAYLAERQGAKAVEEFQKILDHRGLVLADPVGAITRLQLGRAFVLSGEKVKAKAAYEDFLGLWKDADSNLPTLKQAQAEHAKLQ